MSQRYFRATKKPNFLLSHFWSVWLQRTFRFWLLTCLYVFNREENEGGRSEKKIFSMVTKADHRSTAEFQIRIFWQPATRMHNREKKNISCKEAFDFQSCVKCSQENHVNAHWSGMGGRISLETGSPLLFHQKICSSQALPVSLRWFSCCVSKPSKN